MRKTHNAYKPEGFTLKSYGIDQSSTKEKHHKTRAYNYDKEIKGLKQG